ncbi:hypothetical protein [Amycolatopsis circi]|uniref:hypothetical protein n=1 Tax=Amycolatopsis circi TaxID=871959 RepID=UPI000E24D72C|nr:hypothetical protein [Amycolatopsis circi]
MFSAGAPEAATRTSPFAVLPMGLKTVLHRRFESGKDRLDGPIMTRYFTDLAAGHDVGYEPELVANAQGNTFISLARELLHDQVSEPIDLVVVAHDGPDFDPRLSAPVNLTAVLPGGPMTYSVSGQGPLAGFLALRVAAGYVRRKPMHRVLILIMEQRGMPYAGERPPTDAAVALLFEAGAGNTRVAVLPGIDPADARAEADRLAPAERYGPGLTSGPIAEGRSATALWAEPPAVLADYDPIRGTLGICAFAREIEPSASPLA